MIAGMKPVPPDRLRDVVDAVLEALDEGLDGPALAARAMLSPFHFSRLVRAGIGETPAAFRRRLLLERAAWRLGRGATATDAVPRAARRRARRPARGGGAPGGRGGGLGPGQPAAEPFAGVFPRALGAPRSR